MVKKIIKKSIENIINDNNIKQKNTSKSLAEEYLDYHDIYVKKFGKERTLVLMQVGSFYEAYSANNRGPDLNMLEELTDACIAHKGMDKSKFDYNNPLMWGFPIVATTKFMNILIENGYRLIIIDQVTPKPNITREVVAIHSPATYLESTTYKSASNFITIISIEEINQRNGTVLACIGMSAIDVSTGEVFVHEAHSNINDEKLSLDEATRFIKSLIPKEIIIFKENLQKITDEFIIDYLELTGKFYQIRDTSKDNAKISYQKRILEKVYPERENMTSIIDTLGLSSYIYVRKALIHMLVYVSDHYQDLIKGICEPEFYLNDTNMVLGNDAINQLNIVDGDNGGKINNLLDVINKASTSMGKRYVKFRLVSPYTNVETINNIYDIVELFLKNNYYVDLDRILKKIGDIERLSRKIKMNVLHPNQIVDFINSCKEISNLFELIKDNKEIKNVIKCSNSLKKIKELNTYFDENINIEKARLYNLSEIKENIFNEGIHDELDKLQNSIINNHDIMNLLSDKLNELLNDSKKSSIVLKHNNRDGYYFQLTEKRYVMLKKRLDELKNIKINNTTIASKDITVTKLNNIVKLAIPFLQTQTCNIDELQEELMNKTHKKYIEFLKYIDENYDDNIVKIINHVTKIDYYATISKVAQEYNYVKPIIKNSNNEIGYIKTQGLRHPIVERIVEHEYIPHDIEIGTKNLKGMLIYGLNSAGKSVLMKAIGISLIMAQAGFYVPAYKFVYYPYKSLYTRITANDNLFKGLSSYTLEMVELNSILKRSDNSTLVIGDEVCKTTESISANAIIAATLLKLSDIKSSFIFTTHLHELMDLDEITSKKDIKAFHLSVEHDEKTDSLIYDRKLKDGSGERVYGITVAKYIIKDHNFIDKAIEIKNKLLDINVNKKSRYNANLMVDKCTLCGKTAGTKLETHHINHQKDCDNNGFVVTKPHIQKNDIFNLMVVCDKCHDKIHNKTVDVDGFKMTSNGKKIIVKNNVTIK